MFRNSTTGAALAAAAVAALLYTSPGARAAGSYDGTWVLDFPAADYIENASGYVCPALRLPVQVRGGEVEGSLHEVPSAGGGITVEAGGGSNAVPVTGTVHPDGTVNAQWGPYRASGRLDGKSGEVTVKGECGPRVAQAIRVGGAPTYAQAVGFGN